MNLKDDLIRLAHANPNLAPHVKAILASSEHTASRPIWQIAQDIRNDWKRPYFGAVPYLDAMESLDSINEDYGMDSGSSVVLYFLANANGWRGPVASSIKAELKALVKTAR